MASQQELITAWREYFDEQLSSIGRRAPDSVLGETSNNYVRRACEMVKPFFAEDDEYRQVDFSKLRGDALGAIVPIYFPRATSSYINPDTFPPGEKLRMVTKTDPQTGVKSNVFYGKQSFVRDMTVPGRRVLSFGVVRENVANYNRSNERFRA
jgi:hypothetical protein